MHVKLAEFSNHDARCLFDSTRGVVILKEDDNFKYPKIEITVESNKYRGCIKLDSRSLGHLSPYLPICQPGVMCACDAVLFYCSEDPDRIEATFIELKSREFKNSDIENKFYNSRYFVAYLLDMYSYHNNFPRLNVVENYVLFSMKPLTYSNPRFPVRLNAIKQKPRHLFVPDPCSTVHKHYNELTS